MPRMQHQVTLTSDDRDHLTRIIRRGTATAHTQRRARILLKTDRAHRPRLTDAQVADACVVAPRTVARAREDWCRRGRASLERRPRPAPPCAPILDAADEARVVAVACSTPPAGYAQWSLRLLAERVVALEITDAISHETVRRTLKKTRSNPGCSTAS